MNNFIYLRPLTVEDADTSYKWRNNPVVWQFTKFNPANLVTRAIEAAWIEKVVKVKNDYRFAICLKEAGTYVGNIQLLNVKHRTADLHLFIGDPAFWGKGIGQQATALLLAFGFNSLQLKNIKLEVHKDNLPAQSVYKKSGFQVSNEKENFIEMSISSQYYKGLPDRDMENNEQALTISLFTRTL